MSRPPVLLIDSDPDRRRRLSQGLASGVHEVVPCVDAAEGLRFARGLETAIVVAPAALVTAGDGSAARELAGGRRTLVLLGGDEREPAELPDGVSYLAAGGLAPEVLLEKIHLLLLGREVGVAADLALESLVGDLAENPLLELLRSLAVARVSGRLELPGGVLHLEGGGVTAAEAAGASRPVTGHKAFCRLARLGEGPFRFTPGPPAAGRRREIDDDLDSLIAAAIGDALVELPDRRSRLRVEMSPRFFDTPFTPLGKEIITAAHREATVGELLDTLDRSDGEIAGELEILEAAGVVVREEAEPAVLVVTDSTSDLPLALARDNGLVVIPLTVRFGDETYRDRVDLEPAHFYQLLESRPEHPASSPPSARQLSELFGEHAGRREILAIHLSEELSETVRHSRTAARVEEAADPDKGAGAKPSIQVVDSRQVSLGLGLLALFAARMAARGAPADEIRERLEAMRERIHTLFVVDTLEYLARGGRIGKAQAWVGKVLRIKPILGIAGGEVVPVDRVRGGRAAHPRILDLLAERCPPGSEVVAAIAHARAPVWADRLRQLVEDQYRVRERIVGEMGPVVGTHAGPGTVGVALFAPTAEEISRIAPLGATT